MRVAVVAPSPVPFTLGGAERAWNGIVRAVNDRSEHACELLKIPTPETDLSELIAGYRRFARLDVAHFDRVISSKYPAWLAPHDDHLIYLFHRLRGLYDTYPPGRGLRADVRERDKQLKERQNQENIVKLVHTIAGEPTHANELKLRLNEYIRELDKCLAYLRD